MDANILWYFADPMCSWCWGFSPVIQQIKEHFNGQLKIALVLGGLRAGETRPLTPELREEILHHWREVNKMSGQTFCFEKALPEGFIYNTEPACRALVVFGELNAEDRMAYLQAIQSAFYVDNQDVTNKQLLARLAGGFVVEQDTFLKHFDSQEMIDRTQKHFLQARKAGVKGFPTLVLQRQEFMQQISSGYMDFETLKEKLEAMLVVEN